MILITFTIIVRIFLWNCPGNVILLSICQYYKNKKCKSRRSIFLFLLSQTFMKISRNVVIKQGERFLRNENFLPKIDVIEDHFESRLGESNVRCLSYVRSAQYSYLTLTQFEIQTKTPVRHLQT